MMDDQPRAVSYFQKAVKLASSEDDENLGTYLVNLGMARIKQVRSELLNHDQMKL